MAQGNGSAVHIELLTRDLELALDRARLRGEGLVDLDEIYVAQRSPSPFERNLRSRHGTDAHNRGIDTSESP